MRMRGPHALSALLHQLCENTALVGHGLLSAKSCGEELRDAFGELGGILIECAQDSEAGEIMCILDALDEWRPSSKAVTRFLRLRFFSPGEKHEKHLSLWVLRRLKYVSSLLLLGHAEIFPSAGFWAQIYSDYSSVSMYGSIFYN